MTYIRREDPAGGVARIVLARPGKRNAQNPGLLRELDEALLEAATDPAVRVIVLAGDGPDFSSGHDLRDVFAVSGAPVATMGGDLDAGLVEGHYAFECETYLGLSRRWRDLPKPTIAAAHGRSIAGALMLLWPMDIIIASEEATFSDPVTAFGVNGVEYFTHVWELGHRKARELLFTGEAITAAEAHRLGMVNHVVPREQLDAFTLTMASTIAARPAFGLRLAKESVNRTLDAQGQSVALDSALALHNLGHAANIARTGSLIVSTDPLVSRSVRPAGEPITSGRSKAAEPPAATTSTVDHEPDESYHEVINSVREFLDSLARARLDAEAVARLRSKLSDLNDHLVSSAVPESERTFGRAWKLSNRGQALVPDLVVVESGPHQLVGTARFSDFYHGQNGAAHGGTIPLLFDEAFGRLAVAGDTPRSRTAYLNTNYRAITPIGPELDLRAWIERAEGRKRFMRCTLYHGDTLCAEAEALFVELVHGQA